MKIPCVYWNPNWDTIQCSPTILKQSWITDIYKDNIMKLLHACYIRQYLYNVWYVYQKCIHVTPYVHCSNWNISIKGTVNNITTPWSPINIWHIKFKPGSICLQITQKTVLKKCLEIPWITVDYLSPLDFCTVFCLYHLVTNLNVKISQISILSFYTDYSASKSQYVCAMSNAKECISDFKTDHRSPEGIISGSLF